MRHGLMASFMAKWKADVPGSGGHIHQSLWDPPPARTSSSTTTARTRAATA